MTWYCDNCGKAMGVGYDCIQFENGRLFCCRQCMETWTQGSNNTEEIAEELGATDVTLEDEP